MKHYKQLTQEKRYQIHALLKSKASQNEISRIVGVSKSTISREFKRNTGKRGYRLKQAQKFAIQRKGHLYGANAPQGYKKAFRAPRNKGIDQRR